MTGRRQQPEFLRALLELLRVAVVDRVERVPAARQRLVEIVDDVRLEERIAGDRGQGEIAELQVAGAGDSQETSLVPSSAQRALGAVAVSPGFWPRSARRRR